MEDNFYKTSTERLFGTPKKQQDKLAHDKVTFAKERPLVTAVVGHLKEIVSQLEKVSSIENLDDPEAFMREVAVNKKVCQILKRELNTLEVKVKKFDDKKLR